MAPLFNLSEGKTLKGITIGALSLSMIGASFTMPAAFAADDKPAQQVDTSKTLAKQIQGIPGQYQIAHSKKTNKVFVAGSNRDMSASTLARLDSNSLKIEATAGLPITRSGTGYNAGYSALGAFGIDVDDENGTVWVTNTRTNAISVYDQQTLKLLWTDYAPSYEGENASNQIEHPREVKVNNATGKAYITGRFYISEVDLKTHEVRKLRVDEGAEGRVLPMNMNIDGDKMYVPVRSSDTVKVVDLKNFKIEREIKMHADVEGKEVRPADSAVDHSTNELYVSSQGQDGSNAGVTVYDLTTGEYKKSIPFGEQALAMVNDDEKDLVYVSDFKTGKVGVIDTRSSSLIGEVQSGAKGANDIALGSDGEIYVANKDGYAADAQVPFTVDRKTGEYVTSSQTADSITKVKVATTDSKEDPKPEPKPEPKPDPDPEPKPNPDPAPEPEKQTVDDGNGATVTGVKVAENGKDIELTGTGWKNKAGDGGSSVAVKYDAGDVKLKDPLNYNGADWGKRGVVKIIEADNEGNFKATIPFPTTENSNIDAAKWAEGTEHEITLLSGSLKKGDAAHSVTLKVTIGGAKGANQNAEQVAPQGEQAAANEEAAPREVNAEKTEVAQITPRQGKFEGYPEVTPSDPDKTLTKFEFKDIDSNPFKENINFIAEKGITFGWNDGTFRPGEKIERGAMAAYLYRMAGSPRFDAPAESPFTDVKTTDPFYKEIAWLKAAGITTGWDDGTFRPKESVNRDAMAAYFYRAAGSPEFSGEAKFKDLEGNPFKKEIAWLAEQGITKGWDDGTFRPSQAIDRDAMAAFINRYMDKFDSFKAAAPGA